MDSSEEKFHFCVSPWKLIFPAYNTPQSSTLFKLDYGKSSNKRPGVIFKISRFQFIEEQSSRNYSYTMNKKGECWKRRT